MDKQWGARYLVGWFLDEFAQLEIDIEQALGWLLGLSPHSASILLRHLIVFRKIEALRAIIPLVLSPEEGASSFDDEIKPIIRLNDEFRKEFAHTPFREERETGSIELLERLPSSGGRKPAAARVVTQQEVVAAIDRIHRARQSLKRVVEIMALKGMENIAVLAALRQGRNRGSVDHETYVKLLKIISPALE